MTRTRRTVVAVAVAAVAAVAVSALTGCSRLPVSATYLGDPSAGVTAVAPAGWVVYDKTSIPGADNGPYQYLQAFTAVPIDPAKVLFADTPGGIVGSRLVAGTEDDAVAAARNAVFVDLDTKTADGTVVVDADEPVTEGPWLVTTLRITVTGGDRAVILQRTAVGRNPLGVDAEGRQVRPIRVVAVGCTPDCAAATGPALETVLETMEVT
jgi:hypothetical protein